MMNAVVALRASRKNELYCMFFLRVFFVSVSHGQWIFVREY